MWKELWKTYKSLIIVGLIGLVVGMLPFFKNSGNKESVKATTATTGITRRGVAKAVSYWVKYKDLDEFVETLNRRDLNHLEKMVISGKMHKISQDTRVLYSESGIYNGIVFVTFEEGEYKNMRGYTTAQHVR